MAGATIFVMYQDGTGNVTVGVRDGGQGHVEPTLDSTLQSGLTLLAGSGVVDGMMVANVHCTTCKLDSSSTSTSSPWIAAWNEGSAIDSTSTSYTITQHSTDNTRQFDFDLTAASISSDTNPFLTSGSAATSTASGSSPTGSSSNTGSAVVVGTSPQTIVSYEKAHGIIMALVVVLLFPIGAIGMRLQGNMNIHRGVQMLSLVLMIVGFILGIKLATMTSLLYKGIGKTHTVFGTIIFVLFLIQPIFGILHHRNYLRTQARSAPSHIHIWYGRAIMLFGVVNGGLGLKLAADTHSGEIAYGVVAGVMGVAYIVAVVARRKEKTKQNERVNIVLRGKGGLGDAEETGSEELRPVGAYRL